MAPKRDWLIRCAKSAIGEAMERYDFRTQRLFVDQALGEHGRVSAERAQANYLLNVLRLKAGDTVLLFNGQDGEWLARLEPQGRKACDLLIEKQTRSQPNSSEFIYCFAPLKQARLDYMVQKAVEMGVGRIQPVMTQHTQISRLNMDRLRANIVEAAEQCGVLAIPVLEEMVKLDALLADWPSEHALVFCDETAAAHDIVQALSKLGDRPPAVLIGPEGGFSTAEIEQLRNKPFVTPISLGPRILRADTAGVAAMAAIQLIAGDWQE